MLLNRIRNDIILKNYIKERCEENNISISVSPQIVKENYIIIKVDDFYNNEVPLSTPPSVDCLIIQKCKNGEYAATLVELKATSNSKWITISNIQGKFKTTLYDFMLNRYKDYFDRDYKRIKLLLITNIDIYRRDLGLKLEILSGKRFVWRKNKYLIDPRMPVPELKNC